MSKDSEGEHVSGSDSVGSDDESSLPLPPPLTIELPNISDIDPPEKPWSEAVEKPTHIVLLTVQDVEFIHCYVYLKKVYYSNFAGVGKIYFGEVHTDEGDSIERVKVALVRCSQITAKGTAAQNIVTNVMAALEPKGAVCAGYCGQLNDSKTKLGDVVISRALMTYDLHLKSVDEPDEAVKFRAGMRPEISKNMGLLSKSAADGWNAPLQERNAIDVVIHKDMQLLSGPELMNDKERRDEIVKDHPYAVAIELDGPEGIYAAVFKLDIEWVIIKGISEYPDGLKSAKEWRSFASAMSASVVFHMFKQPEILVYWPTYRRTFWSWMKQSCNIL